MICFTAHTFKCVCHCRRAMFRVLGMYNFVYPLKWYFFPICKWIRSAIWRFAIIEEIGSAQHVLKEGAGSKSRVNWIFIQLTLRYQSYICLVKFVLYCYCVK